MIPYIFAFNFVIKSFSYLGAPTNRILRYLLLYNKFITDLRNFCYFCFFLLHFLELNFRIYRSPYRNSYSFLTELMSTVRKVIAFSSLKYFMVILRPNRFCFCILNLSIAYFVLIKMEFMTSVYYLRVRE